MKILYAYAAAIEAGPIADRLDEALQLGTGKAESSATLAERLCMQGKARPDLVLLFGLCGAYPEAEGAPAVGKLCVLEEDRLADEGLLTEGGFMDLATMGLGLVGPFAMDPIWTSRVATALGGLPLVRGATVSSCSGTAQASAALARRTGAQVETMEGAAVALVCGRWEVPLVQLRCVSNRTGDRGASGWDLTGSVERLQAGVLELAAWGWT